MRKATIDAFLLTVVIGLGLITTNLLFTYPWLIVAVYALAYLLAVLIRLRQVARQMTAAPGQEQLFSERFPIGLMFYWGMVPSGPTTGAKQS